MRSEFSQTELGEVLDFFNGKPIKPGGDGQYPAYGSNGIIGRSDGYTHEKAIIIGRVGAYCGSIAHCRDRFWASDNTIVAKPRDPSDDVRYFSYLLRDLKLNSYAGGAAQPLVTHTALKRVPALIASPPIQRRIAAILSAYDDLIENNTRRIAILEEMAQALYREWFVNFRFPGHQKVKLVASPLGKIPQGWEVAKVGDRFTTVLGGTPSRSRPEFWEGGTIPWINSGEVNELRILEASELITPAGLERSSAKLIPPRTTVIAITGATLGQVSLTEIEVCANQSVVGIYDTERLFSEYLYLTFAQIIRAVIQHASGGAQQHINKDIVNNVRVVLPPRPILEHANGFVVPLFDSIANLLRRIANLRRTRDLLLPKLVSGEIDVSDLDIETAAITP